MPDDSTSTFFVPSECQIGAALIDVVVHRNEREGVGVPHINRSKVQFVDDGVRTSSVDLKK